MKKFIYGLAAFTLVSFGITSCSDDDNNGGGLGDEFQGGEGTMQEYTPEQSKEFLENTATEALNMLNPEDQRAVIELCSYFVDRYGDLDLPENFAIEEDEDNYVSGYMRSMARAAASADPSSLTRAVYEYVYDINFNNFKGIYEPGNYEWEQVGESNDVVFRFTNAKGQNCELKAVGSSTEYNTSVDWTEDKWFGEESYQYNFTIPAEVSLTLTENGTQLVTAKVISNVNFAGHNFSINTEVKAANIIATAQTTGNDSKVTETAETKVGGQLYISETAVVNGSHLCDLDFYQKNFGDDGDAKAALSQLLRNGEAQVNVINKVYVDGIINYSNALYDALGLYADTAQEAESYVTLLNQNIIGRVRYNNTTTVQAKVTWSYTTEKYGNYVEYYIEPQLEFPDGTTYYFSKYFESGFDGVETLWNNLTKKYEAIWDAAN